MAAHEVWEAALTRRRPVWRGTVAFVPPGQGTDGNGNGGAGGGDAAAGAAAAGDGVRLVSGELACPRARGGVVGGRGVGEDICDAVYVHPSWHCKVCLSGGLGSPTTAAHQTCFRLGAWAGWARLACDILASPCARSPTAGCWVAFGRSLTVNPEPCSPSSHRYTCCVPHPLASSLCVTCAAAPGGRGAGLHPAPQGAGRAAQPAHRWCGGRGGRGAGGACGQRV